MVKTSNSSAGGARWNSAWPTGILDSHRTAHPTSSSLQLTLPSASASCFASPHDASAAAGSDCRPVYATSSSSPTSDAAYDAILFPPSRKWHQVDDGSANTFYTRAYCRRASKSGFRTPESCCAAYQSASTHSQEPRKGSRTRDFKHRGGSQTDPGRFYGP